MAKLYNLARMTTATTGTGTITLGSAVSSYLSFASAGVQNGETVTYAIIDGSNREIGRGVYTSSGTTLTRSVLKSTNSNTAINLSGTAEVFITSAAEDIGSDVQITGGSITGITDLAVADGGTGVSSFTAYSLIAGGTTSTGALQSVSGVGTSGQVLTSNGASALPTWQGAGGMTLITALSASGTNPIASGLTLTDYKILVIVLEGITQNSGSGRRLLIGTSTSDDVIISGTSINSAARGFVFIDLNAGTLFSSIFEVAASSAGQSQTFVGDLTVTTASTAISFALDSTGSFNAGTFRIYGIK